MMSPARPAHRLGPLMYLVLGILLALIFVWAAGFINILHAQTPADPAWRTCTAPSGQICLAVDVTTQIAADPVTGLPRTVQYLPNVKVTASWSGTWTTQRRTATTNSAGRVNFTVPKGKKITLVSDTQGRLVSVTNPTTGAPEGHRYIEVTRAIAGEDLQSNARGMLLLEINPAVAIK